MVDRWRKLSSQRLLETPYFNLRSDALQLPDSAVKAPYYIIERADAAMVFPLTPSQEVVMVRQYRPAIEQVELGLPAGLLEPGEEPAAAARRELLEESGYGGGEWERLLKLSSSPGLKANWIHLFLARDTQRLADPSPDEHERIEVELVPIDSLMDKVLAGEIVSSSGVAAILLALRKVF